MPRGPRVDVRDGFYHVIARGVDRGLIFRADRDREDFLRRLSVVAEEEDLRVFAFVLMGNHFHVVVRREGTSLGDCMRRLLTGYSVSFNRRRRRTGHLFENRYKAVLCEQDAYLFQLVRYVHLNPVRAKVVPDPSEYPWSSHRYYLRERGAPGWLDTKSVLDMVGGRRAYRRLVAEGMAEGKRPELCGKGEAGTGKEGGEGGRRLWLGGQVLGDERFARRVARGAPRRELEREMREGAAEDLPSLGAEVARKSGLAVTALRARGRNFVVSRARRELVRRAVLERNVKPVMVSRYLGIRPASITGHLRALRRGEGFD